MKIYFTLGWKCGAGRADAQAGRRDAAMNRPSKSSTDRVPFALDPNDLVELVDAIVAAVDLDRAEEVRRVSAALDHLGLVDSFNDELRLSGVPSTTWQRCEFCGDAVDQFEISEEAA
jgi:hypothetical protein